jgi:LysR family positive regulator for ilvC
VTLKLHTGDPALSIKRILSQEEDIALAIRTPQVSPQLHFVPVDKVPLVMIAPKSWRISQLDQIDWQNHPVVLPETGYARDVVLDWFQSRDITPHVYASVGGNEAIVAMVALGCGLGMVPQIVLDHSSAASQVTRFLPPETVSYDLGLCCLASRKDNPLIAALLSLVSELS